MGVTYEYCQRDEGEFLAKMKKRQRLKDIFVRNKKEEGLSLIEVLITIFLLSVVLLTLVSVFIYGFNLLARTKQVTLATQITQEEMEFIRNKAFDDILILASSFTHENLSFLQSGQGILAVDDGPGDNIKKITVSVTWNYRGSQLRKDVVTYMTREGINKK